jgi:hypothetical protein
MAVLGHDEEQEPAGEMEDETEDEDEQSEDEAAEEDSEDEDEMSMKKEASGVSYVNDTGSVEMKVTKPEPEGKEVPDNDGLQLVHKGKFIVGDKTKKLNHNGAKKADQVNLNTKPEAEGEEVPDSDGLNLVKKNMIEPKSKIKGRGQELFGIG